MRWFLGILLALAVLLAGAFFALSAPDIPRSVLEAKYATPPSRFITLPDGARAHYRIRGADGAPTLLLLHGSNATLFTWEPWSKALSNHFRVVSVDLPGHGLTGPVPDQDYSTAGMAKFVDEFADALGIKSFALAGNSMGGGVAAYFAEMHPDRVKALVLVDAGGIWTARGDHVPLAFTLMRQKWLAGLLAKLNPKPLVREGLNDAIVRKAILTEQMIDLYSDMALLQGSRDAMVERFGQMTTDPDFVRDHVAALTMPVLILWGEQDHLIPIATAHAWNKAIPGSILIVYPATGHIPMEEAAGRSAADVRHFLETREK
jgi:pimeloyl-ACP methyl ester carboxylesterase